MTIQQAFEMAVRQHESGQLAEAESIYRKILAVEPRHAESLHYLGVIAHQVGRNDAAVDLIRQAIAHAPGYAEAYNNLGVVLKARGALEEAAAAYRQATALKPDFPDARGNLETLIREMGQPEEPIDAGVPKPPTNLSLPAAVPNFLTVHDAAPQELKGLSPAELAEMWPAWVARQDRQIRTRIWRGEADSLANFLLLGSSFTAEPRITDAYRATLVQQLGNEADADRKVNTVVRARSLDLARALAQPGEDERLLTMREVANRAGRVPQNQEDPTRLAQYLFDNLVRFLDDARALAAGMGEANQTNPGTASISLANLYQTRGLSTDSSMLVDFALEQGLRNAISEGFLKPASVRRVGVVGVGLDLIDKLGGYDLYPPQITQPFVLVDTLLKLGLAAKQELHLTTFDISTRVNQHIERVVARASESQAYEMNLVHDNAWEWSAEAVRFWATFGDQIGEIAASGQPAEANRVLTRSVRVHPEWVARIRPIDLNFVCQELRPSEDHRFELLVATNVLCYYDSFQQSLALRNAARILQPGGILLTTEVIPTLESTGMHLVGSTYVQTSKMHGYTILCYKSNPP